MILVLCSPGLCASELTGFGNHSGREPSASQIGSGNLAFGHWALTSSLDISPALQRTRTLDEGEDSVRTIAEEGRLVSIDEPANGGLNVGCRQPCRMAVVGRSL